MIVVRKHNKGKWWPEEDRDLGWKMLSFCVSPFLGFLYSLRRMNTKSSYVVFFLFAVLFGLGFETSIGKDDENRGDAAVYRYFFELGSDKVQYVDFVNEYVTFENSKARDIYVSTMVYLVTRISRNYHLFFGALAIVFAFFMLKSLKFLTEEEEFKSSFLCLLITFLFIFRNGIFNINGCRFWTASWVAIYSVFQIFRNDDKRYIFLCALTPLIHQSYWFFLSVLLIAFLSKRFVGFWKVMFFVSFIASSIAVEIISDVSEYLPPALQFLVERYSGEIELKTNLYQILHRIFTTSFRLYIGVIFILFINNEKNILGNPKTNNLYQFLLVYMSIINFVIQIPSLGSRYFILSFPIIAYLWLVSFGNEHKYRRVIYLLPFVSLFNIYERLHVYLNAVDFSFYISSPLYQVFKLFS